MSEAARQIGRRFTWDDYRTWTDEKRWEIIGGDAHAMAPAPAIRHQRVVGRIHRELAAFVERGPCEVLLAPTDLVLSNEDVFQPDLMVVCDPAQIHETHVEGAPTLVVEVLSPSTAIFDQTKKMDVYALTGVKEVWLITPYPPLIQVFLLDGSSYRLAGGYAMNDPFKSPTFPDLKMNLMNVFDFPVSDEEKKWMVREPQTPPHAASTTVDAEENH